METVKLVVRGRLPGLNDYTGACRSHPQAGAAMKKKAEKLVKSFIETNARGITHAFIEFDWYEKNKRRDKDNIAFAKKFILDALVDAGVLETDGWDGVDGFTDSFGVDKSDPRIEITISY